MAAAFDKIVQTNSTEAVPGRISKSQDEKVIENDRDHKRPNTISDMEFMDPAIIYISQCEESSFQKDSLDKQYKSGVSGFLPFSACQKVYERKSLPVSPSQAKNFLVSSTKHYPQSVLNMTVNVEKHRAYSTATNVSYKSTEKGHLKRNRQNFELNESHISRPSKRAPKNIRKWEWTEFGKSQIFAKNHKIKGLEFRVLSYNVLAQNLLEDNSYLYDWSKEHVLKWSSRKYRLLNEIKDMGGPDVLCLQEVNHQHYHRFFQPELNKLGYDGVFQKRTGDKQDGCATFYRRDKFKLEEYVPVEYYKPGRNSLLDRDNVAVIVKLCPVESTGDEDCICVANTHLLYNPRRGDIKLAQLMILLAEIDKLAHVKQNSTKVSKHIPTILCGDFNSEPYSDLYNLLVNGFLQYEGLLIKLMSGQKGGRRGRDNILPQNFFPRHLRITDQCRYAHLCGEEQRQQIPSQQSSSGQEDNNATVYSFESENSELQSTSTDCLRVAQNECESKFWPDSLPKIQENIPQTSYDSGTLWHFLNLVSVYRHTVERLGNQEAEVTTHHEGGSSTVDFLFYNVSHRDSTSYRKPPGSIVEGRLRLMGRYGLMSEQELKCLPDENHPSDHLPLVARFLLES